MRFCLPVILYGHFALTLGVAAPFADTLDEIRQGHSLHELQTGSVQFHLRAWQFAAPPPELEAAWPTLYKDHPEQMSEAQRVFAVNQEFRQQKVDVCFNVQARDWKASYQDLRDLESIIAQEALSPRSRSRLDTSRVRVVGGHGLDAYYYPATEHVLIDDHPGIERPASILRAVRFGIVPISMFLNASDISLEESTLDGHRVISTTLKTARNAYYILDIDPEIGYRYRRFRAYSADGRLVTLRSAKDYRSVDGVYFPFRHETDDYDAEGNLRSREEIDVERAVFNQKLPPDALMVKLPAGTRIVQLRGPTIRLADERVLSAEDVSALLLDDDRVQTRAASVGCTHANESDQSGAEARP